jgi:lipoprotein NlpD
VRLTPEFLFPAALLMCLFFYNTAYSEKKNSSYLKGTEKKFNKTNNNIQTNASSDITSYHKKNNTITDKDDNDNKQYEINQNNPKADFRGYKYYVVKKGDTLFSIARRSRISLKILLEFNNIKNNSPIYTGMKLKIPCDKNIKNSQCKSSAKSSSELKPVFLWPLKKVKCYTRDGKDGVKSIGIFIKGNPGGEVIASEKGIVKRVGYMRGYGKYIVLNHKDRYITVYSNLMDVNVKVGDNVQKGVTIGNISNDMTLHFQIDYRGKPENPLKLLQERG